MGIHMVRLIIIYLMLATATQAAEIQKIYVTVDKEVITLPSSAVKISLDRTDGSYEMFAPVEINGNAQLAPEGTYDLYIKIGRNVTLATVVQILQTLAGMGENNVSTSVSE